MEKKNKKKSELVIGARNVGGVWTLNGEPADMLETGIRVEKTNKGFVIYTRHQHEGAHHKLSHEEAKLLAAFIIGG